MCTLFKTQLSRTYNNFLFIFSVTEESRANENEAEGDKTWFTGTKLYIIIACISALVLVAIVQASCTIYKMARKGSGSSKVCQFQLK